MEIVNQPKIILTHEEAEAFTDTIRLLNSITASPESLNTNLIDWVSKASAILERIWQDDNIDVE